MPVPTHHHHHQQQQQQHRQTPPLQQLQHEMPEQQQQQARGDDAPRWGPEELRQLLDILGDPQRQRQQQQQQPSLLQHHQHLLCGSASLPGSGGMSPHVPEEEVEQVNNGHGHAGHVICNVVAGSGMRVNDTSSAPGVTAGVTAAGDSREGCHVVAGPVQIAGQVVQTGEPTAPPCL
jgi:hypothetical protein